MKKSDKTKALGSTDVGRYSNFRGYPFFPRAIMYEGGCAPGSAQDGSTEGGLFRQKLLALASGAIDTAAAEEWGFSQGGELFYDSLSKEQNFSDAGWSPAMAVNWIAFRDDDVVRDVADERLMIVGFWRDRDPLPASHLAPEMLQIDEESLRDLVGERAYRTHRSSQPVYLVVGDRPPRLHSPLGHSIAQRNERFRSDALRFALRKAHQSLWEACLSGKVTAVGIQDGAPREIPRKNWAYLCFGHKCDPATPGAKFCRPDTLHINRSVVNYRRVRFAPDDIKRIWLPIAQSAQQIPSRSRSEEPSLSAPPKRSEPKAVRAPTLPVAAAAILLRLFPDGRPPLSRKEFITLLEKELGRRISLGTLRSAIRILWPRSP